MFSDIFWYIWWIAPRKSASYIDRWIRMRSRRIRTNRFGNWRRFAPVGFPTLQFLCAWMRIAKAITCDTNIYVDSILYSVYIYIYMCIHIHIYGKEGTNNKDAYEKNSFVWKISSLKFEWFLSEYFKSNVWVQYCINSVFKFTCIADIYDIIIYTAQIWYSILYIYANADTHAHTRYKKIIASRIRYVHTYMHA